MKFHFQIIVEFLQWLSSSLDNTKPEKIILHVTKNNNDTSQQQPRIFFKDGQACTKKISRFFSINIFFYLSASLIKLWRVGGDWRLSKAANLAIFSWGVRSVSMNLSNSGWLEGIGTAKMAPRTRDANLPILKRM